MVSDIQSAHAKFFIWFFSSHITRVRITLNIPTFSRQREKGTMCHILASISQWFSSFHNYFTLTYLLWNSQMPCYLDCIVKIEKKICLGKYIQALSYGWQKFSTKNIFPRGNIFLIHFMWIYWLVFCGKYFWTVSSMLSHRRLTLRGDQDGGIGGHWAHLPSWTYQKYIYIWSNSCWKQTGIWQKDS